MDTLSSNYRFDYIYYRLQIAALPHHCILPFTIFEVLYQLKKEELQQQNHKQNK